MPMPSLLRRIRNLYIFSISLGLPLFAAPEDALREAAEARDPIALEAALGKKPNVNTVFGTTRETALFLVLGGEATPDQKMLKCVRMLIAAGADLKMTAFSEDYTALHSVMSPYADKTDEHLAIMEALAAAGADLNALSKDGKTPLSLAIEKPDLKSIQKLISLGAELNPLLPGGQNYVHLAARLHMEKRGVDQVLEVLIAAGVDFDTPDESGRTPLHYIAASGNEAALKQILKHKPRIDRKDNNGKTPVELALQKKGISETAGYERQLAAMIRRSVSKPKKTEVGEIFSASAAQVDIIGRGISKVKSGQKLTVITENGDYTLVAGENMHTKLKAKASPAAAARMKKGNKVYLK